MLLLSTMQAQKILVMRRGLLGDTIAALPTLWLLRGTWPNARITFVGEPNRQRADLQPWASALFAGTGVVDEVISFPGYNATTLAEKTRSLCALLRHDSARRSDIVVVLDRRGNSRWDRAVARALGARRIVGPVDEGIEPMRSRPLPDVLLSTLEPLGLALPAPERGRMDLELSAGVRESARRVLASVGIETRQRPHYAVAPYANMPSKQWPADRFSEAIGRLVNQVGGTALVFAGPRERSFAQDLAARSENAIAVTGDWTIRETGALMATCDLFVGVDTGLMHLAAAVGLPCVAIFSSRDLPGLWEPYAVRKEVLRTDPACSGCMLRTCPEPGHPCLTDITVDMVVAACKRVVKERS